MPGATLPKAGELNQATLNLDFWIPEAGEGVILLCFKFCCFVFFLFFFTSLLCWGLNSGFLARVSQGFYFWAMSPPRIPVDGESLLWVWVFVRQVRGSLNLTLYPRPVLNLSSFLSWLIGPHHSAQPTFLFYASWAESVAQLAGCLGTMH